MPSHIGLPKYDTSHDRWYVPGTRYARREHLPQPPVSRERAQHRIQQLYSPTTFKRHGTCPRSWLHKSEPGRSKTGSFWPLTYSIEPRCSVRRDDVISAVSASVFPRIGCLTAVRCRSVRGQTLEFLCPSQRLQSKTSRYLWTGQASRHLGQYLRIHLPSKTPQ